MHDSIYKDISRAEFSALKKASINEPSVIMPRPRNTNALTHIHFERVFDIEGGCYTPSNQMLFASTLSLSTSSK